MRVSFGLLLVPALLCFMSSGAFVLFPLDASAREFKTISSAARQAADTAPDPDGGELAAAIVSEIPVTGLKQRSDTVLARRWAMTRARVKPEADWLRSCEKGACRDPRAETWLRLVAQVKSVPHREQPEFVQKRIFGTVGYLRDRATDDHWANPLSTLLQGGGDCEDHVLLKRALLTAAGYPEAAMRLLILETAIGLGHMALAVDADGPLVLDNRYRSPLAIRSLKGDRVAAVATDLGYFQVR